MGAVVKVRKRSANQAYQYLTSLPDSTTFQQWITRNETDFTWVHKRNSMTNIGKKFYYICNYRIKKGYYKCPAVIYALFPTNGQAINGGCHGMVMVYACGQHDHRRLATTGADSAAADQPSDSVAESSTDLVADSINTTIADSMLMLKSNFVKLAPKKSGGTVAVKREPSTSTSGLKRSASGGGGAGQAAFGGSLTKIRKLNQSVASSGGSSGSPPNSPSVGGGQQQLQSAAVGDELRFDGDGHRDSSQDGEGDDEARGGNEADEAKSSSSSGESAAAEGGLASAKRSSGGGLSWLWDVESSDRLLLSFFGGLGVFSTSVLTINV